MRNWKTFDRKHLSYHLKLTISGSGSLNMQRVPFKEGLPEGIFVVLVFSSNLSVCPQFLEIKMDTFKTLLGPKPEPVLGEALLLLPGQVLLHMDLIKKK